MEYWCAVIYNCWLGWCGNGIKIQNISNITMPGASVVKQLLIISRCVRVFITVHLYTLSSPAVTQLINAGFKKYRKGRYESQRAQRKA